MLFSDERHHSLRVPSKNRDEGPLTIANLIDHLCQNLMKDSRQELFVLDSHLYVKRQATLHPLPLTAWHFLQPSHTLQPQPPIRRSHAFSLTNSGISDDSRPGILVLINDADWELEGEEAYELQDGDNILFVSTLHGG